MDVHREMRAILGTVARGAGLTAQQIEMLCVLENRQPSFGVTRLHLTDHGRTFGATLKRSVAEAVAERWRGLRAPERAALTTLSRR